MNIKTTTLIFLISLLTGCAATYNCNLGHECSSALDSLNAAKENGGNSESAIIEPTEYKRFEDIEEENSEIDDSKGESKHLMTRYGGANLQSTPVYKSDLPIRIWVAPENFKNENILIGAYEMYTTVPGGYVFGNTATMNGPNSSVSGMLGPLDERKDLGFTPEFKDSKGVKPKSIFDNN